MAIENFSVRTNLDKSTTQTTNSGSLEGVLTTEKAKSLFLSILQSAEQDALAKDAPLVTKFNNELAALNLEVQDQINLITREGVSPQVQTKAFLDLVASFNKLKMKTGEALDAIAQGGQSKSEKILELLEQKLK